MELNQVKRLSPDQEPVRGLKAHRRYFEKAFKKQPQRDLKLTSLRAEAFGAMMYDSGEWSQTLPEPAGKHTPAADTT